jgi:phytanoyl-CoA hydroxylase
MAAHADAGSFFAENGYYLAKALFDKEAVRELEADFDRIVRQLLASGENVNARWTGGAIDQIDGGAATEVLHTHNVQQYSGRWLKALTADPFLDVAEAILGPDIVLHHSKLFQKPAEKGAPFPMHQDWSYFPTEEDTMIAAIVHVSDATDEMGCLRVYPGSHRLGRKAHSSGQVENDLLQQYPIEGATVLEAEAGDVVFFSYFTLHGSMPNRSTHVRKTVLVQMYSGRDRVEEGVAHPDERLVLRGWNHRATRSSANLKK